MKISTATLHFSDFASGCSSNFLLHNILKFSPNRTGYYWPTGQITGVNLGTGTAILADHRESLEKLYLRMRCYIQHSLLDGT